MYLCLRVDLDYVPWDTPDAQEFGHGEPAMFLRMLEMAKRTGSKFQFFASSRVLRAFPSTADAVLNEGHDLDWYCKHPGDVARSSEALELFLTLGHTPIGIATKEIWPTDTAWPGEPFQFLCSPGKRCPKPIKHIPVESKPLREATRGGISLRDWADSSRSLIWDAAARRLGLTLVVRPQVLAKHDPKATVLRELIDLGRAVGLDIVTCRDLVKRG